MLFLNIKLQVPTFCPNLKRDQSEFLIVPVCVENVTYD